MQESVQLTRAADLPTATPWGGPHAHSQLLADQCVPAASMAGPLWSLHKVIVQADGPRPTAIDQDCLLLVLDAEPFFWRKTTTHQESRLTAGSRLYFAGETDTAMHSVQSPVTLLILQLQRKQAHGCIDIRSRSQALPMREGDTLLHCVGGACHLRLPRHLGGERTLEAGDTLHIHLPYLPAFALPIELRDEHSRLIDMRINHFPKGT